MNPTMDQIFASADQNVTKKLEVLHLSEVRISSASFTRIRDAEGRYALLVNKSRAKKGETVLTPIGGALEATDDGLRELQELLEIENAAFEKGKDLRFKMSGAKANKYREWFLSRQNRELSPAREVGEELIDETGLLSLEDLEELQCEFCGYDTELQATARTGQEGQVTLRLLEIYEAKLKKGIQEKLEALSKQANSVLHFVTAEEIRAGQTVGGIEIGTVSQTLIAPKKTIAEFA